MKPLPIEVARPPIELVMPPQPPIIHANGVTCYLDGDQFVMTLLEYFPDTLSMLDLNDPSKLQGANPKAADVLATPPIARIVTTFTVAAALHHYLERALPFARKQRAAPPGTQGVQK